jgi:hypothetical protein
MFDGVAKNGAQNIKLPNSKLQADQISFVIFSKPGDNSTRHEFKGTVKGDVIDGTLKIGEGATSVAGGCRACTQQAKCCAATTAQPRQPRSATRSYDRRHRNRRRHFQTAIDCRRERRERRRVSGAVGPPTCILISAL